MTDTPTGRGGATAGSTSGEAEPYADQASEATDEEGMLRKAGSFMTDSARDLASKARGVVDNASDRIETAAQQGYPGAPVQEVPTYAPAASSLGHLPPSIRRTRKARLRLSRLDPWSVMKTTFLFAIAFAVIQFVAVWVLWSIIEASGAFDAVNKMMSDLITSPGSATQFALQDYINTWRVLGLAAAVGFIDVVLVTALATLGSFLYNLAATVIGGLEVTLAED